MTRSDLKNGMVVEFRDKSRGLVHNKRIIDKEEFVFISNLNDDLTNASSFKDLDIMKIFDSNASTLGDLFSDNRLELIWERKEQPKLSDKDKKKIKVALKKVKEICSSYNNECKKDCEFNVDGLCIFADDPSDFELDNLFKD